MAGLGLFLIRAIAFNVGIGTTGPTAKFEVIGAGTGTGFALRIRDSANADKVAFLDNGKVGIGTTGPGARLTVQGNDNDVNGGLRIQEAGGGNYRAVYMNVGTMSFNNGTNNAILSSAGAWTNASDIAYKTDIIDMSKYGLSTVLQMKPREYKMKSTNLPQIGFIAQELEQIVPEVVSGEEGSKGLSYGQLTAVLTKAIQEQQAQIKQLEVRLVALEGRR